MNECTWCQEEVGRGEDLSESPSVVCCGSCYSKYGHWMRPETMMDEPLVFELAGRSGMKEEESVEFSAALALYVFRHNFNEDLPLYNIIGSMLLKHGFKASPLQSTDPKRIFSEDLAAYLMYEELERSIEYFESRAAAGLYHHKPIFA